MSVDPKTQQLFEAIAAVNYDRVKLAIDAGASIDSPNDYGQTPLAVACRQGNLEIVNLLVAAGAQMQVQTQPITSNDTAGDVRSTSVLPTPNSSALGIEHQISFENLIGQIDRSADRNSTTAIEQFGFDDADLFASELPERSGRNLSARPTEIEQFVLDDAMSFLPEPNESPAQNLEISFENLIDLIEVPTNNPNLTDIEQFVLDDALPFAVEKPESPVRDREISLENLIESIDRPISDNIAPIDRFLPIETKQPAIPARPNHTGMQQIATNWQNFSSSSDAEDTQTFDLEEVFAARENLAQPSPINDSEMFVDSELTMTSLGADSKQVEFQPGETYAFDLSPELDRLTAESQIEPDRLTVPMGEWIDNETYVIDNFDSLDSAIGMETYVLDNFDGLDSDVNPISNHSIDDDRLFAAEEARFAPSGNWNEGETYAIDLVGFSSPKPLADAVSSLRTEPMSLPDLEASLFATVGDEDRVNFDEPDFDPDTQTTTDIFGQSKPKFDEDELGADEENATNTSLMAAVIDGDLDLAQQAIEAGASLDRYDWNLSYAPLGMAIDRGHLDIVQCLLGAGANPHCGSIAMTALGLAAERGEVEIIQTLLPRGVDINAPVSQDGWTALLSAIKNGHRAVVQLLVTAGANVNVWSRGETPILLAAKCEEREIYQYLYPLVNTAIRLCADRDGEHLLQATRKRRIREQNRPVEKFVEMATIGNIDEIERAISIGIEVDELGAKGHTALMAAAYYGHRSIVKILLAAGADPNLLSDDNGLGVAGMTALMLAAGSFFASNRHQIAQLLIASGADVNQRGANGKTAIMYAALAGCGYLECVEKLIAAGADLDLQDDRGHTVLSSVAAAENYPMFNLLMQAGASTAGLESIQLIQAAGSGNVDRVKSLLSAKVNLDLDRGAALGNAAAAGHTQVVELLIRAGANVNLRDKLGFTPIASAAYVGHGEIVRLLIEAGADIQAPAAGDAQSYSVLEYAQMGLYQFDREDLQHAQIIRQLQQLGAS